MAKSCGYCKHWDEETITDETFNEPAYDCGEPCMAIGTRTMAICRENSNLSRTAPYDFCSRFEPK